MKRLIGFTGVLLVVNLCMAATTFAASVDEQIAQAVGFAV